jgi:hypothetical protein
MANSRNAFAFPDTKATGSDHLRQLYLNADGVLADFDSAVAQVLGKLPQGSRPQ